MTTSMSPTISADRQAALDELLQKHVEMPFANHHLSRVDIMYLLEQQHTDFRHVLLQDVDLSGLRLDYCDFRYSECRRAILANVSASNAHFEHAHLCYVNGVNANFTNAHFQHVDLYHSDLRGAELGFADLDHANLDFACLLQANLRNTFINLNTSLQCIEYDVLTKFPTDRQAIVGRLLHDGVTSEDNGDFDLKIKKIALARFVQGSRNCWTDTAFPALRVFGRDLLLWAGQVLYPWFSDQIDYVSSDIDVAITDHKSAWAAKLATAREQAKVTTAEIARDAAQYTPRPYDNGD